MPTGIYQRKSFIERFCAKVLKTEDCWLWTGAKSGGYGLIKKNGSTILAHRAAFGFRYGANIPAGLTIDHLCRNRGCVNPAHLEVVTSRENILRGASIQAKNAAKTYCLRGHPFSKENTMFYRSHRGVARICRECSRTRKRI